MTDALAEEQQMEIEALESIYMDDLKGRFLSVLLSVSTSHILHYVQWLPMRMLVQRDGTVHLVFQSRT